MRLLSQMKRIETDLGINIAVTTQYCLSNIMAKSQLLNAEVDKYGWSYTLTYYGNSVIYRYNKNEITIYSGCTPPAINPNIVKVTNMYKKKMGDEWVKINQMWMWMWLEGFDGPISIDDAVKHPGGKDIVRKYCRNGLFRFVLLRIYILRYIRHLKHITWMPGSVAVQRLEKQFYRGGL